jgi:hypothetical protein
MNVAFTYALMSSALCILNGHTESNESLSFKAKAIECLREDLSSNDPHSVKSTLQTILVLLSSAVRRPS